MFRENERIGIILANTGTTAAPRPKETRAYLKQFLSDPRVLDLSPLKRWLILNLFILPTRPKQSAEAFSQIWTDQGSPLLIISDELRKGLEAELPNAVIQLGMRYGEPSIPHAIDQLLAADIERLVIAPLFPQYASATIGSVLELAYTHVAKRWNVPPISVLPPFYGEEDFLHAWAEVSRPLLREFEPDWVIFSYHGLPERHIRKGDPTAEHCLAKPGCCSHRLPANRNCYRMHCLATSRALIERLALPPERCATTFQSRLGRDRWLEPSTDDTLRELPQQGIKRLAVMCPAFTADCLETLEEIGVRAREDFLAKGGEAFMMVPSLNSHPAWVKGLANMLRRL